LAAPANGGAFAGGTRINDSIFLTAAFGTTHNPQLIVAARL
jgi:hypothetical protein